MMAGFGHNIHECSGRPCLDTSEEFMKNEVKLTLSPQDHDAFWTFDVDVMK